MYLHRLMQVCMKDNLTEHTKYSSKAELHELMRVSVVVNALLCMGKESGLILLL